jgi:hypothetical protein
MHYIGIYGSQKYDNYDETASRITELLKRYGDLRQNVTILTSDTGFCCRNVKKFAEANGIKIKIYGSDWKKFGHTAGVISNYHIVHNSEYVIVFWDGASRGCKNLILRCRKTGTPFSDVRIHIGTVPSKQTEPRTMEQPTNKPSPPTPEKNEPSTGVKATSTPVTKASGTDSKISSEKENPEQSSAGHQTSASVAAHAASSEPKNSPPETAPSKPVEPNIPADKEHSSDVPDEKNGKPNELKDQPEPSPEKETMKHPRPAVPQRASVASTSSSANTTSTEPPSTETGTADNMKHPRPVEGPEEELKPSSEPSVSGDGTMKHPRPPDGKEKAATAASGTPPVPQSEYDKMTPEEKERADRLMRDMSGDDYATASSESFEPHLYHRGKLIFGW